MMNYLFKFSLENKMPIELIYMNGKENLTHRSIIVRKLLTDGILAYDMGKRQLRTFKRLNILSAARHRSIKGATQKATSSSINTRYLIRLSM
jgi:hypothetical protein